MKFLHYIKGFRKGKDAHSIEKDAMTDSFLAESLEGYDMVNDNHIERLTRMQEKIQQYSKPKPQSLILKWSAAAILLACFSVGVYYLLHNSQPSPTIASNSAPATKSPTIAAEQGTKDSSEPPTTTTTEVVGQEQKAYSAQQKQEEVAMSASTDVVADMTKEDKPEERTPVAERAHIEQPIPSAPASATITDAIAVGASKPEQPIETNLEKVLSNKAEGITVEPQRQKAEIIIEKEESSLVAESAAKLNAEKAKESPSASTTKAKKSSTAAGKGKLIKGKVVDANGEPIPFATVEVVGGRQAAVTDEYGNFTLSGDAKMLMASFVGYESKQVLVNPNSQLLIALNEDTQALNEVVVAGYGVEQADEELDENGVEAQPEPTVGFKAYNRYLKESLVRPTDEACAKAKGRVVLLFDVDSNGRPQNIKVRKSLCESADKEAIRLVQEGPLWTKRSTSPIRLTVRF